MEAPPRRNIERREHDGQVRFSSPRDALERSAPRRCDFDHDHPPIGPRRGPPHPAAVDHGADRVRHRRQADALDRGEIGEHPRVLAQNRQEAEMRRRGQLAVGAELGRDRAHDQRDDMQDVARGLARLVSSHGCAVHPAAAVLLGVIMIMTAKLSRRPGARQTSTTSVREARASSAKPSRSFGVAVVRLTVGKLLFTMQFLVAGRGAVAT